MRPLAALACVALISVVAAAVPLSPLTRLAGKYIHKFKNGDVEGDTYYTTDVVEIVPLDAHRAEVSFYLNFFNGHDCSVDGIAKLEGRKLVYRDTLEGMPNLPECRLEIWRDARNLYWEDRGTCSFHCGARGGLHNGRMSAATRRPMRTRHADAADD
jgi:hypothetical protein